MRHVDATFPGRILPHLLNGPGALGTLAHAPEVPLVASQVDDVLDEKADPDGQRLVLGRTLKSLKILIHANLNKTSVMFFSQQIPGNGEG